EHAHDVVRIARTVHQRIAGVDALAFLDVDVNAARNGVFALLAVVADDVQLAHALADFAVLHRTVDLADHGGFSRLWGFEQFHHTRQAARDVLGLGGGARDLGQHVAGVDFVAIGHRQVGVHGHKVPFLLMLAAPHRPDDNRRYALLVGGIHHHPLRPAGD